ncbi:amidase [Prescottella equi]|uniref:amidase n=1 Tax=Rhodococcus hoagii TaxID=43767 RepID=UPI0020C603A1|nr:amidase family protein [Prescottella equi]
MPATASAFSSSSMFEPQPPAVVDLGISELSEMLLTRRSTSEELVRQYLARIDAYDDAYGSEPGINAVITLNPKALDEARALDTERRSGHIRGPLHGVPIVVKDNYDTADMPTSAGSEALKDFQPAQDATQIQQLKDAGAIIVAKTNMHEFAAGTTTISSLGGQTHNPYDQTRIPGGSSGGTAAAVAASFAAAGMGTDTCGSGRGPAAFNNLVGFRTTSGLASIHGIAPMSNTQDVGGPITKSVRDAAIILDATAGYDPADPKTAAAEGHIAPSYLASTLVPGGLVGKRLALLTGEVNLGTREREQPTSDVIRAAADDLRARGADVVEIALPQELVDTLAKARVVNFEFKRDLDAYLGQDGATFNPAIAALTEPADKLTLSDIVASGTVTPAVVPKVTEYEAMSLPNPQYDEALANREKAKQQLSALFADLNLDALVYPTMKSTATRIDDDKLPDDNCRLSALTGFPALTLPAGFASDGMPVGVELLGQPFAESNLLSMGYDYEQATHHRTPPVSVPELTSTD